MTGRALATRHVCLLLVAVLLLANRGGTANKTDLYFQVQLSTGFGYHLHKVALEMAVEAVNRDPEVLASYNVRLSNIVDAKCLRTPGVKGFIDHLTNGSNEIVIIGADCSGSSVSLADLSQRYELVQISPASTSPELSDTKKFKYFLRTVPSDVAMTTAIVQLMNEFKWKYISILTEEQDLFLKMKDELTLKVQEDGKEELHVGPTESFVSRSPEAAVEKLKATSGRVIFINSYAHSAIQILCKAYQLGMVYPDYAWITFGWYREVFWSILNATDGEQSFDVPCTYSQVLQAIRYLIVIDLYPSRDEDDTATFIGNMTSAAYTATFSERYALEGSQETYTGYLRQLSTFGYDALWLAVLALDSTHSPATNLSLFNNSQDFAEAIYGNALRTTFEGASGLVEVTPMGDRSPDTKFMQYFSPDGVENLRRFQFGFLNKDDEFLRSSNGYQEFNGEGIPITVYVDTIELPLFVVFTVLAFAGILFAVFCLVFNLVFRNKETVKLSSPYLNIAFIGGCILWYLLVVTYGLDNGLIEGEYKMYDAVCPIVLWMGTAAFTLIFGSIMAKAFRVHYIFKSLKFGQSVHVSRKIKEWHMFSILGVMLLMDLLFLVIVTALPPTRLRASMITTDDGPLPKEVCICDSDYLAVWLSILAAYKIVKVVLCLIFAFEVRQIRVKELNDSNLIIFSVYAFLLSIIAMTPLIFTLRDKPDIFYAVAGAVSLIATTLLLAINFVPKMYSLYKDPSGKVVLDFSNITRTQVNDSMRKVKGTDVSVRSRHSRSTDGKTVQLNGPTSPVTPTGTIVDSMRSHSSISAHTVTISTV